MDKKKLTIIICTVVLLVALVGIVVAVKRDNSITDNTGKQESSVEQSDDEQGLKDAGTLEDSSESGDSGTTNNNSNSGNFSDFFPEKNSGSTTTEDELNGEQGTQEEVQEEEEAEEPIPDTELEESENTEEKYGDIIRP